MRVGEALGIIRQHSSSGEGRRLHLVCGFTPMHLATFVRARACQRLHAPVELATGVYGDVADNLRLAAESPSDGAFVVLEWPDLDPRLGIRSGAGWTTAVGDDVTAALRGRLDVLQDLVTRLAGEMRVVVAGPTLPLPPMAYCLPVEAHKWTLNWKAALGRFIADVASISNVRVLDEEELARRSPASNRHDPKLELFTHFPFTTEHADVLAEAAIEALFPQTPRKGLITDLDNTLWHGILGEVGVDGVSWTLADHAQAHGLYQQLLASLAETGVLIGVASKNEPDIVGRAFGRTDLYLPESAVYPVEAGWGPKSESIGRILKAWNIAADAVVFIDDSPMELAEVAAAHAGITCLQFRGEDPGAVLDLIRTCRRLFGRSELTEEDRIRVQSLRAAPTAARQADASGNGAEFVAELDAEFTVTYSSSADDRRSFELLNKTNQFNLNGRRFTESEWRDHFRKPGAFRVAVGYQDRFGPLGRIAALLGHRSGDALSIDAWVLSCRAFSRQVEHHTLKSVFGRMNVPYVTLAYNRTDRNEPVRRFLAEIVNGSVGDGDQLVSVAEFDRRCPTLHGRVLEKSDE